MLILLFLQSISERNKTLYKSSTEWWDTTCLGSTFAQQNGDFKSSDKNDCDKFNCNSIGSNLNNPGVCEYAIPL